MICYEYEQTASLVHYGRRREKLFFVECICDNDKSMLARVAAQKNPNLRGFTYPIGKDKNEEDIIAEIKQELVGYDKSPKSLLA